MDGQVLQCLQATLSADEGTRRQAEEQLRQLFLLPGTYSNVPPGADHLSLPFFLSETLSDQQKEV